ncbi:putative histidine kinase [Candidatus Kuenenia stuttgartiensis]|uniref:histidine kinase n=1 Tax=Kuenenia stuttgartiensis TaxID=174633 RepID=A0A6G7GUB0_KUEST|nr:ATP-binding protein [Candidatus Kuenenia stuttgartiensis]QII12797.1 putative histidine kinase [Candidatus Kuenenia stuttgartiensis]
MKKEPDAVQNTRQAKEEENRFFAMVNAIGKPMFSVNNEGVCDFVNAACLKALCYEENGQMLGKKMYELIHFTDEEGNDIPVEKCRIYQAQKQGREIHGANDVFLRADGSHVPFEYTVYLIYQNEKIAGSLVIFDAINETTKKTVYTVNYLKKTLVNFVHKINNSFGVVFICVKEVKRLFPQFLRISIVTEARFSAMSDTLQRLRQMINENCLSCDKRINDRLNGTIAELCASFEELRKTIDGVSKKGMSIVEYLEDTTNVSMQCKNLIKSLVAFVSQREPVKTRHKMNDLIKGVIDLYEYQANNKKIDIFYAGNPAVPTMLIDAKQIELVITNIINNAFMAIEELHGMSATPELQRAGTITIETGFLEEKKVVEILIKDSGSGIEKDFLPKIFDPFFSKFKNKSGPGTGLSLANKIVQMHNGTIEVESIVGKGTAFRITLPLEDE